MTDALIANRYRVVRLLGEGAMGRVTQVEDTLTGDAVALKVLTGTAAAEAQAILQLKQEFRLMTRLKHPNCCAVYDYGQDAEGQAYFTMELVPGRGLDELLPLDAATFRALFPQLLLALGYIHQQGLVHLDIKAANVRVTPEGVLKLMDYGLMEYAGFSGGIRGTLPYLSPEMARRAPVDQRSDLYSVGCLAYELLTGQPPFVRRSPVEVLRAHLQAPPEPPSRAHPGLPSDLERLVLRLMAKEPIERYQSAYEALEDLGVEVPAGLGGSLLASPLVGREAELAVLQSRFQALQTTGEGGGLLLWGGSGLGKSRLLEELRYQVQLADVPFVRGRAAERQAAPYAAIVEVLRALVPLWREHVPERLAAAAPVLVSLLPELGAAPAPAMDSPRNEMLRLQATVTGLLVELAERQPFVMALDGWHAADTPTRELLTYLQRNRGAAPILLVIASRQAPESAPEGLTGVALSPLPLAQIARMVSGMLGIREVTTPLVAGLAALTEGNPFHLEQVLDHLVKGQHLVRRAGKWNTELDLAAIAIPTSVVGLVTRKLEALSTDARLVARTLAVIGQAAPIDLIGSTTHLPDERLFTALEELVRTQVVSLDADRRYALGQEAYQAALYEEVPADERRSLHALAATALDAELQRTLGGRPLCEAPLEVLNAVASHSLLGQLEGPARRYALEAGKRNVALFALVDAERFLTEGLSLLAGEPGDQRNRLEYLRLLGEVNRYSGRYAEAVPMLQEAATLAEAVGETQLHGRLLTTLAKAHQVLTNYDEALAFCAWSETVGLTAGDAAGAARSRLTSGRIRFFRGQLLEARADAERALELARAGREEAILGLAHAFLGYLIVATAPEHLEAGVEHLRESLRLLDAVGDRPGLNDSYNLLGNALNVLGQFGEAREAFGQCQRIGREAGLREDEIVAGINLALTAWAQGEVAEAGRHAASSRAMAEACGAKFPLGVAMVLEALAEASLGRAAAGLALSRAALAFARGIENSYIESLVLMHHLDLLLRLGQQSEAREAAGALDILIRETGNKEPESRLSAMRAELLARDKQPDEAAAAADQALALARAQRSRSQEAQALTAQARARLAKESFEEALPLAEQALAMAEAIGSRLLAAEVRGLLGEAALALGRTGEARTHFAAMQALAAELGAAALEAQALFGLAAAEPYNGAQERATTARERLVAIAESLDEVARQAFLGLAEHRRVLDGTYVAFGLPIRRGPASPSGPLGLRMGSLGGM